MIVERFKKYYSIREEQPKFSLLSDISAAFSHLPYENITKIIKDATATQPGHKLRGTEEVLQDHLRWKTGGTCFSLCNALQDVLEQSGIDAYIAMADMHYGKNIHCAVIANLNGGDYLLDPGYLLHHPIPLPPAGMEAATPTSMNTVILRSESRDVFSLFTKEIDETKWRYRIHTERISRPTFLEHWMHSFSLNSMDHLMLARASDSGRLYFRKNRFDQVQQHSRRKMIVAPGEMATLTEWFGVPSDLILQAQKTLAASR
jgi:arylamine N-acetyltransferase